MQNLFFSVTECLGGGDGGEISVRVPVSDQEIEDMKTLVRKQFGDPRYFEQFCSSLYRKIREACLDEDPIWYEGDYDPGEAAFLISVPREIFDAAGEG